MRSFSLGLVFLIACSDNGSGSGDDQSPTDGPPVVLTPAGVLDADHSTIVHITWSTPEPMSGWVEFGLDGAFDKVSPAVTATDHVHQALGLKAGRTYTWRAVVQDGDKIVKSDPQSVDIPPAPSELPTFHLVTLDPDADVHDAYISVAGAAAPGSGAESPSALYYVAFIDAEGDYVWYHTLPFGRGTSALDVSLDGKSVWWLEIDNFRQDLASTIFRMTLDGTVLSETYADSGHHAAVEMSDGRFAFLGRRFSPGDGTQTLMSDRVLIATEGDTTGAQSVELFDYLDDWWEGEFSYPWIDFDPPIDEVYGYKNVVDLTHSNSIAWIEAENAVYPYARLLDTLLKIDVDTGALEWQMSGLHSDFTFPDGDPVYVDQYNSHLWSWGHYSQIWQGGLMMFDNGSNYQPPVSSIVEIAYDEATGTAEEVFRYIDPEGGWTNSLGDVWKLPSGNYVASWMSIYKLTEVTPDGDVVWRLDPENGTAVRRIRLVTDLYSLTPLPLPSGG